MSNSFRFQRFTVQQDAAAMKVGTDGILLGAWAAHAQPLRALDIGAGTGLIALMLAQRFPDLAVDAVEVDAAAAAEAMANVDASPFAEQVQVYPAAIQDFASQAMPASYDLIVSNPPFFTGGVLAEQEGRASVRHTVKLPHQDLLRVVQRLLAPKGSFCVILPWLEGLRFTELAASYQLHTRERIAVSGRPGKSPNRLLLRMEKEAGPAETQQMSIYAEQEGQTRSAAFASLTSHFYL